jgi:hypothetical protein
MDQGIFSLGLAMLSARGSVCVRDDGLMKANEQLMADRNWKKIISDSPLRQNK